MRGLTAFSAPLLAIGLASQVGRPATDTAVPIRVLRIRHNPTRRPPAQHLGFLIGDRSTVLHVGDADPAADNFALLSTLPRVDVALLPYWYVLTDNSRRFVAASIAPRRIVAMHMPVAEAGSLTKALAGTELQVAAPVTPGQPVTFPR